MFGGSVAGDAHGDAHAATAEIVEALKYPTATEAPTAVLLTALATPGHRRSTSRSPAKRCPTGPWWTGSRRTCPRTTASPSRPRRRRCHPMAPGRGAADRTSSFMSERPVWTPTRSARSRGCRTTPCRIRSGMKGLWPASSRPAARPRRRQGRSDRSRWRAGRSRSCAAPSAILPERPAEGGGPQRARRRGGPPGGEFCGSRSVAGGRCRAHVAPSVGMLITAPQCLQCTASGSWRERPHSGHA
jgi:hypothetical protein